MDWRDRISIDPEVATGKPVVQGTRIPVAQVLEHLAAGWTLADLRENYPALTDDDIHACLSYASEALDSEHVYPLPST